MGEYNRIEHTFSPIFNEESRILILGSFPSVKSRENSFYYGHPFNRFWKVLASVLECEIPNTIEEKRKMLIDNHIALWDVIQSCDIIGSSDSSIKNVEPTNIPYILKQCDIRAIYANGKMAGKLYRKYLLEDIKRDIIELPSTSPANAGYGLEKLIEVWKQIKDSLE